MCVYVCVWFTLSTFEFMLPNTSFNFDISVFASLSKVDTDGYTVVESLGFELYTISVD